MELERGDNIFILTHQAIVRCIYAYLMDVRQDESPWMDVPLHTLMKLTPRAYGTLTTKYRADIPAVSTWRAKGSTAKHHDREVEGESVKLPGLETPERRTSPGREGWEVEEVVGGTK
jgi:broad specificity phosphatase PhoE